MSINIQKPILSISKTANGNVNPHRFIDIGGAMCGADEATIGVSLAGADDDTALPIGVYGIVGVELSAAVAEGDDISVAAEGKAKSWVDPEKRVGRTLKTGFSGDVVPAIILL
jgi:hypothetical protein